MDLVTWARTQWDRLAAMGTAAAGAAVLTLGWRGVSATPYPAEQTPYIVSAGFGALFLLGVSSVLWLSADLHDEWRKLDRIDEAIRSAAVSQICSHDREPVYRGNGTPVSPPGHTMPMSIAVGDEPR